ncbi:unnamed protein product [Ascophyllum nodosum]
MERTSGGEGNLSGQGRWGKGVRARRRATNAGLSETVPIDLAANDADVKAGQMPAINDDSSSVAANSPRESGGRSDRRGFILLATVPLVWGTYGPSVKYLYQMGDSTPGLFFNLSCYLVSAAFLTAIAWVNDARRHREVRSDPSEAKSVPPQDASLANSYAARAGLELGAWLFLGGTVQVWGLELTSASRAAFLVQLTTVIVPVLEAVLGRRKLKTQVWLACALAMVGVALVSLGGILPPGINAMEYIAGSLSAARFSPSGLLETITSKNIRGDLLIALSALFYSLHVVRLGAYVSKVETLSLARAKAIAEVGFSFLSVVVAGFVGGQWDNISRYVAALASKPELLLVFCAVVVWNGALTSAYAMWAQTRGQAVVAPSEANLVYSLQPLFSTFFAVLILKESFRGVEMAGAGIVLASLLLATYRSDGK